MFLEQKKNQLKYYIKNILQYYFGQASVHNRYDILYYTQYVQVGIYRVLRYVHNIYILL